MIYSPGQIQIKEEQANRADPKIYGVIATRKFPLLKESDPKIMRIKMQRILMIFIIRTLS
jgi:hypothetical protein